MYELRTVTLKNGNRKKRILVIDCKEPEKQIIGEFLMTDAPLLNYAVLDDIDAVLADKEKEKAFSGNRCALKIQKEKTLLSDLWEGMLDDVETMPSYQMDTVALKRLIERWKAEKEAFQAKENSN